MGNGKMESGAEIAERQNDAFGLTEPIRQPTICVSICFHWPDAGLFQLLHSLSRQTYPIGLIRVCLTYLGGDVRVIRDLQNIQSSYEGKFAGIDMSYTKSASEGAAHNKVLAASDSDYFLKASAQVSFSPKAIESLVSEVQLSSREIAAWEVRRAGKLQHHASISDLDSQKSTTDCTLYRQEVLERVGGFAETADLPAMAVEFSYRLRDSGYRIVQTLTASYLDQQTEPVPEIGETPLEAWLSGVFCRLRYGGFAQRLSALFGLFTKQFAVTKAPDQHLIKMATARPIPLVRRALSGKLSAVDFPICGWQGDFISAEKRQPRYVRDHLARTPLVSVVVRTQAGRSGPLAECLRSIANQTYPNLEVVIVEGGTTGFSRALVQKGLFGYGVQVLNLQDAEGFHGARMANMGAQASLGDFILVVDDDQLLFPDHIERCVVSLLGNKQALAVYGRSRCVETDVISQDPYRYREGARRVVAAQVSKVLAERYDEVPACALLIRRDAFDQLQGFDEGLKGLSYWQFFRRLSKLGPIERLGRITSVCRLPVPGPQRDIFDRDQEEARQEILDIENGKIRRQVDAPSLLPDHSGG